jgi:threonine/homoserine/homoserine lactone efflux protein
MMGEVIAELLPLLAGATLVPIYPIIGVILLQGAGGLTKAIGLMTGNIALRLVQGILFGIVFAFATEGYTEEGSNLIVDTLLLLLGITLLIKAYMTWRKEEDPEDALPKWMSGFNELSVIKATGVGALYVLLSPKQWVFTLSAISIIGEAQLGEAAGIALYLCYTIATQVFVLTLIVMVAVAPQQASQSIRAIHDWLARHNQTLIMVTCVILGIWFMFKSISGFLA